MKSGAHVAEEAEAPARDRQAGGVEGGTAWRAACTSQRKRKSQPATDRPEAWRAARREERHGVKSGAHGV